MQISEPTATGKCIIETKRTVVRNIIRGLYKIFRTDAVKIIKPTLRLIGHHHPRISSLPHVDTGPTVSSTFGTLSGSPLLSFCVKHSRRSWISSVVSNRRHFSVNFIFWNRKKSQGAKSGDYVGLWMTTILYFARNCWVRTEVWNGALLW
jgi:hypothetical protein